MTTCAVCGEVVETVDVFGADLCGLCIGNMLVVLSPARGRRRTVITRGRRCRT